MSARVLRLGTRGSRLAMVQTHWVADRLREDGARLEIVPISTSGDRIKDVPLGPGLGQAFFTKEIEDALLDGRIDIAVHSCKDLATRLPDGLTLGAVPPREDPRDVLVSTGPSLRELPAGAHIGTASVRRQWFVKRARPDLEVVDMRGNVPTRLAALDEGRMDAVVLAAAGVHRLGMTERITEYLDSDTMLPAAAQGALAIQIREDDAEVRRHVAHLDDPAAHIAVAAERACLRALEAGCQAPVGALAACTLPDALELDAAVVLPDRLVRTRSFGATKDPEGLGRQVAATLLAELGLDTLRHAPWAGPPPKRSE